MAIGAGNRAEPDRTSVRNRVPLKAYHDIPNVPFHLGRKRMLPVLPDGVAWPTATYNWWRALRVMPHCLLWTDTDWQYAATTAWIHKQVWAGDFKLAAELRMRERSMGCTDEARRGLRIRYVEPELAALTPVTPIHAVNQAAEAKPARRVQAFDPSTIGGK